MSNTQHSTSVNKPLMLRWLSAMFARELTPEDIRSYRSGQGKAFLDAWHDTMPEADELARLEKKLNGPETPEDAALEFASAFSWLFHGVGGPKAAPTHQHDWSEDSDGTQMRCVAQCEQLMAACGIGPSQESGESADHVSTQLEFLGFLEEKSVSEADGPWDEYRARLLREHVQPWLPHFLEACERNDRNGLYSTLARLTRQVLPECRN
ncbi:TorD/DmsD family molecular chaperone [Pseudodesulfovibrio tunisiensis]|uniref:TorD/DmsD family molecular chaperone n=1 Tax=Pseudodesulfovibrio tunisiensis TaxID=463192 RepID=UPI001FB2F83D|nr:molecular chaperone TorD family protein [Pseudodesulfovibrio tunisiensis]